MRKLSTDRMAFKRVFACISRHVWMRRTCTAAAKIIHSFRKNLLTRATLRAGSASICLVAAMPVPGAEHWVFESSASGGSQRALCAELVKRLNSMQQQCTMDAVESFGGFTEPPWERLDPAKHADLIAKLFEYRRLGPSRYFDPSTPRSVTSGAEYRSRVQTFVTTGGQMRVWRTRLVPTFNNRPAPVGVQTVVLLDEHVPLAKVPEECPGPRSKGWVPQMFLVTADLSGPDPQVDGDNASILFSRRVLKREGVAYFVNSDTVFRSFGDAGIQQLCLFRRDSGLQPLKGEK